MGRISKVKVMKQERSIAQAEERIRHYENWETKCKQ